MKDRSRQAEARDRARVRALRRLARARLAGLGTLLIVAVVVGSSCDAEQEAVPADTPTAIAWLEPIADSEASGRVTFVEEAPGVRLRAEIDGLEPGIHHLRLRTIADCESPEAGGRADEPPDLLRLELRAESEVLTTVQERLPGMELERGSRLLEGSVVIESLPEDPSPTPGSGRGGRAVACGPVEFVGVLREESEGRWQGPRPTP